MSFFGAADSEPLVALTKLLDGYSNEIGIDGDEVAHDRLAAHIMVLFNKSTRPEDIRRKLDSRPSRWMEQTECRRRRLRQPAQFTAATPAARIATASTTASASPQIARRGPSGGGPR
jgi:hypothetical protein